MIKTIRVFLLNLVIQLMRGAKNLASQRWNWKILFVVRSLKFLDHFHPKKSRTRPCSPPKVTHYKFFNNVFCPGNPTQKVIWVADRFRRFDSIINSSSLPMILLEFTSLLTTCSSCNRRFMMSTSVCSFRKSLRLG